MTYDDMQFQPVGDSKAGLVVAILAIAVVFAMVTGAMWLFFGEVSAILNPEA